MNDPFHGQPYNLLHDRPHSRRHLLLSGTSSLAAGLLASRSLPAQQNNPQQSDPQTKPAGQQAENDLPDAGEPLGPRLKLSLAGYSFRSMLDKPGRKGELSLLDLVDLAARLGLEGVEPTSYYFYETGDDFLYRLKHRAFKAGLAITGTPVNNDFTLNPGRDLDRQLDHVRTWVDNAVKLGAPVIRVFAGRKHEGMARDRAFENVVQAMKKACEYAGSKGIFLALENHGYLTETAEDVIRIIEAVDHPWSGLNLDTGNFRRNPYENITRAAPYALTCQVKAMIPDPEGKGRVAADYDRIIRILRQADYRGFVILEYEQENPETNVPVEIRKLQTAILRERA